METTLSVRWQSSLAFLIRHHGGPIIIRSPRQPLLHHDQTVLKGLTVALNLPPNKAFRHVETLFVQGNNIFVLNQNKPPCLIIR